MVIPSFRTSPYLPPRQVSRPVLPKAKLLNGQRQPSSPPIILTVTRRHLRKNKWVEVAGHYHLSLLTQNCCMPVIVPRTPHVSDLFPDYLLQNASGLLLTEGEDISSEYFRGQKLSEDEKRDVGSKHQADVNCDVWKDHLEFHLVRECLERGIPILGVCRGMQVVNLVRGGDMYEDVDVQLAGGQHIDYSNYDGFRHTVNIVKDTPLEKWFGQGDLQVTSYHHQGIRTLGKGLKPMAWSDDGLVEGYYDEAYDPDKGRFVVGLQFHPERMQHWESAVEDQALGNMKEVWEYEGCPKPYEDFCKAAWAFSRKRSPVLVRQ